MKAIVVAPGVEAADAHSHLREHGVVKSALLTPSIANSWKRCLDRGVDTTPADCEPASGSEIREEQEKNQLLVSHALPVMETLYDQIIGTQSMVVLTNSEGYILHSLGDSDFLDRANRVALAPGVEWSEQGKGTNAIGTALIEERALVVHGHEHFVSANHFLTCSASPICDPLGKVIGVLDVTGDHRSYSPHTLALVKMGVRLVENQIFSHAFPEAIVVHFHARPEYLGTIAQGMVAFSPDGRVLSANHPACNQLGLTRRDLASGTFEQIFKPSIRALLDHAVVRGSEPFALGTTKGLTLHARVIPGAQMKSPLRVFTFPRAEAARAEKRPIVEEARESALDELDTGDSHVRAVLHKVRRVLGKDIPVLIHGETGAGKELLARAIHDDGPRFDKPFVAVNCAAIPEGLIESELFGYEEGAFTGAKRKGNGGRIQQADGGTLFLDEIGDMPAALQARLLRVLQERVVNPLGSTKSIPVDIVLVCATHRRLKELVADGTFREDLYYRLNGLTVNLPPLRSRTDLAPLVALIFERLMPPNSPLPRIEPEVLELFVRHPWPGNIRQLSNLLRTALVMAGDSDCITVDHMPDDFLEEFEAIEQVPRARQPAGVTPAASEPTPAAGIGVADAGGGDLESTTLNLIQRALEQHAGNVSAAARQLGISRNTLYRKLKQIWKL